MYCYGKSSSIICVLGLKLQFYNTIVDGGIFISGKAKYPAIQYMQIKSVPCTLAEH